MVSKYDIGLWAFIFSSDGFYCCYGVIVQWYYLYIKALCIVVFKGFKAVGVVVVCKDNDKGDDCGSGVAGGAVCGNRLVLVVVGQWWLDQELRELPRELYLNKNSSLYDTILTDLHTLIIHKTAYLILIILIIYQDKKIG